MSIEYSLINYPNNPRSRGKNVYIEQKDYIELHIYTNSNGIFKCIFDRDVYSTLIQYYWCVSLVGRDGWKFPTIYTYINRQKYRVKEILYPEYTNHRIEHLNNNSLDFRLSNLSISDKYSKKSTPRRNKKGNLPTGISMSIQNNHCTGFKVPENKYIESKYFSIKEYGSYENALSAAVLYRNTHLNH